MDDQVYITPLFDTFKNKFFDCISTHIKPVRFIQVGAHRGYDHDDIYKSVTKQGWTGLLIEPEERNFKLLKKDYEGIEGVSFLQCAINSENGSIDFFTLKDPDKFKFGTYVSSLNEFHIVRFLTKLHKVKMADMDKEIVKKTVPARRLENLIDEQENPPNFVYIDTESYDFQVIKTINFEKCSPEAVYYEHAALGSADKKACREHLIQNHYYPIVGPHDTLAVRQDYWHAHETEFHDLLRDDWNDTSEFPDDMTKGTIPFEQGLEFLKDNKILLCSRFPEYAKHNIVAG